MDFIDEELISLNKLGMIPGPDESHADFKRRAEYCLDLKKDSVQFGRTDNQVSQKLMQNVVPITRRLFDIAPEWVPIVFSNHRLAPWHGGCAWIFQLDEKTPTGAFFQLREAFATSQRYLGIYDREELVAHEAAHVGRMVFDEPKFEEVLAYRTSTSPFRRWLGPIVQSAREALFFVLAVFLSLLVDFWVLMLDQPDPYHLVLWVKAIPIVLLILGVVRAWRRQNQFSQCYKKLLEILKTSEDANAVIYRLQDREIIDFGDMHPDAIVAYAKENATRSLRWRVIDLAYF